MHTALSGVHLKVHEINFPMFFGLLSCISTRQKASLGLKTSVPDEKEPQA